MAENQIPAVTAEVKVLQLSLWAGGVCFKAPCRLQVGICMTQYRSDMTRTVSLYHRMQAAYDITDALLLLALNLSLDHESRRTGTLARV